MVPPPSPPRPPSLAHLAIFKWTNSGRGEVKANHARGSSSSRQDPNSQMTNEPETARKGGTIRSTSTQEGVDTQAAKDKDLEDDLREASNILFYISKDSGTVKRDTMLRQVGLVKGLMGFTGMVCGKDKDGQEHKDYWSFRSHKSRMIVWCPLSDIYIYANITLARQNSRSKEAQDSGKVDKSKSSSKSSSMARESRDTAAGEPTPTAQGLSDELLVLGLRRGLEDFEFLHGPLDEVLSSPLVESILEKYWTSYSHEYDLTYLDPPHPLALSFSHHAGSKPLDEATDRAAREALQDLASNIPTLDEGSSGIQLGLVVPGTWVISESPVPASMERYLMKLLPTPQTLRDSSSVQSLRHASRNPDQSNRQSLGLGKWVSGQGSPSTSGTVGESRKSSWSSLGSFNWVPSLNLGNSSSRSPTSSKLGQPAGSASSPRPMLINQQSPSALSTTSQIKVQALGVGSASSPASTLRYAETSSPCTDSTPKLPGDGADNGEKPEKWGINLGLGGLTDAMGSIKVTAPSLDMGNLFRFGGSSGTPPPGRSDTDNSPAQVTAVGATAPMTVGGAEAAVVEGGLQPAITIDTPPQAEASTLSPGLEGKRDLVVDTDTRTIRSSLEVTDRPDLLPDLEEAVSTPTSGGEIDLGWTSRIIHLPSPDRAGKPEPSTLSWIIRDSVLLYITTKSQGEDLQIPSKPVLSLYSVINSLLTGRSNAPMASRSDAHSDTHDRPAIVPLGKSTDPALAWIHDFQVGGPSGKASGGMTGPASRGLLTLRDWLGVDLRGSMSELYGKTSTEFLVAKRFAPAPSKKDISDGVAEGSVVENQGEVRGELYLSLGRKEASLTDAEYALRGILRSHPEMARA